MQYIDLNYSLANVQMNVNVWDINNVTNETIGTNYIIVSTSDGRSLKD